MSLTEPGNAHRAYARLAGFLFLWEVVLALGSGFVLSHIAGSGSFAETNRKIAASEHFYRAALSSVVIVSLSGVLLAFALYATLKPANRLLAALAMIFCLSDSFVAMLVRTCDFVTLHLRVSALSDGSAAAQPLIDLMRNVDATAENIGGVSFGIGSLLFFYLFFKSEYIPKPLAGLGVGASVIWTCLYFANLIVPERHALFRVIELPPMALADILTGFYLLLFAVRTGEPVSGVGSP